MKARFFALNIMGAALVYAAWLRGLVSEPFSGDAAFFCWLITAATVAGLGAVFMQRPKWVGFFKDNITMFALIGTVDGFRHVLQGFSHLQAGDAASAIPVLAAAMGGFSILVYATLFGLIATIWLRLNVTILSKEK